MAIYAGEGQHAALVQSQYRAPSFTSTPRSSAYRLTGHYSSMLAGTCGNFRGMRLAGAFFANKADVVDDMLNVEGGFWATTTVPANTSGFPCDCVVLCDTRRRDVGTHYSLHIDAVGATGQRWAPAWSTSFQLPSAMKFMVLTQITLPIEPAGGRHVYSFRLDGGHERFDVPLDVVFQ